MAGLKSADAKSSPKEKMGNENKAVDHKCNRGMLPVKNPPEHNNCQKEM